MSQTLSQYGTHYLFANRKNLATCNKHKLNDYFHSLIFWDRDQRKLKVTRSGPSWNALVKPWDGESQYSKAGSAKRKGPAVTVSEYRQTTANGCAGLLVIISLGCKVLAVIFKHYPGTAQNASSQHADLAAPQQVWRGKLSRNIHALGWILSFYLKKQAGCVGWCLLNKRAGGWNQTLPRRKFWGKCSESGRTPPLPLPRGETKNRQGGNWSRKQEPCQEARDWKKAN